MAWMACVLHHAHAGRRRNAHAMHCAMYYATHCGVHCGTQVRRAPLALYAARYGGGGSGGSGAGSGVGVTPQAQAQAQAQQQQQPQPQPLAACFPEHTPDRARSRWYSFPAMRPDELLLFTQYGDIVSIAIVAIPIVSIAIVSIARRAAAQYGEYTMHIPCIYHASAMPIQTASSVGRRSCGTARCRGWSRGARGAGTPPPRRHAAPSKCVLSCYSRSSCRRRAATAGGPAILTAPYIVPALLHSPLRGRSTAP